MILPLDASTLPHVRHVTRFMRDADRCEIFATRWTEDTDELAGAVVAAARLGAVVTDTPTGAPVAVIVAANPWPNVWSVGLFATDYWRAIALSAVRWIRRVLMPELWRHGALRVECHSLADHYEAHALLRHLGRTHEQRVPCMGKGGEDFIRFAWIRSQFEATHVFHVARFERAAA